MPHNILSVFIALLLWISPALAADIQVRVDRNPAGLDESFQIEFIADEQPDDEPDFTPLRRDFDIRNEGHSSQVSIVNGQYSKQVMWTVTVMAKRAGTLVIPSIAFGQDHSPLQTVVVQAGGAGLTTTAGRQDELFIEVEAEPKNPYVQAQVLYTVRILRQVNLGNARLEEPKLDNAVLQRLTEDKSYATHRNGQLYQVIERRFAVFPQQSGRLTIQPPVLEAEVSTGRRSLFNGFFMQQDSDNVRLRGQAIELDVRPIPPQFSGKHWLPAQALSLSESWSKSPSSIAVGEPLTRTLKLEAEGSTVGNLPELAPDAVEGLQAYPDQPSLNEERTPAGLNASREEKIALIPAQAGSYQLPKIAIPWWNTQTDREEVAVVEAHTLRVQPSATAGPATQPAAPSVAMPPVAAAVPLSEPLALPPLAHEPPWPWIGGAAFLGLGWLTTALAWWWTRRAAGKTEAAVALGQQESAVSLEREQRRRLRAACRANDAKAARVALLAWAQSRWPDHPPRHLDELAARVGGELALEIGRLNQASYAATAENWAGEALLRAVSQLSDTKLNAKPEGLEPLYRTR
ncbi:MAG: protein BatD [Methylococcaceae bacterium]|nr:MAG: protein BatD [Methylococcaceae bacterium]